MRAHANGRTTIETCIGLADDARVAKDWSNADGRHMVGLYAWLHREVYGVEASELRDTKQLSKAIDAATARTRELGGPQRMVAFLSWAFGRERGKDTGRRLTWQLACSHGGVLDDYRLDVGPLATRTTPEPATATAAPDEGGDRRWPSVADRAASMRPLRHVPTGIPTLDNATRGGLVTGKVYVLAGPPGAGKTATVAQLADRYARAGIPTAYLAFDEPADSILVRFGQLHGLSRDDLERCDPAARRSLADALCSLPLEVVDGDDPGARIEEGAAYVRSVAGNGVHVVVVDSAQHARSIGIESVEGIRARVDWIVEACKGAAKQGAIVFLLSEATRAFYRSRRKDEQIDPLAAGKESSSLEYAATVQLVFRSVAGVDHLFDVDIAKNRLGSKGVRFRLSLDRTTAEVVEVEGCDDNEAPTAARDSDAATRILAKLADPSTTPDVRRSRSALCKAAGVAKKTGLDIIRELIAAKRVREGDDGLALTNGEAP